MFKENRTCWVAAPGKINLSLEILGRRADGYHELRSVVMPLALHDRVELSEAAEDSLEVVPENIDIGALCPSADNLVMKALGLMRRRGQGGGVRIRILKRIPIGGGLGGGSSNAAATLVGLNRLWGLGLSLRELMDLGARLGCDVPAIVCGGAVSMEGRGERVQALFEAGGAPPASFDVVLANPNVVVSTASVYQNFARVLTQDNDSYTITVSAVRSGDLMAVARCLRNELEPGVFARYPAIGRLAESMRAAGACGVLLSGSGATVFGLVRDAAHGESVRRRLPSDCWSLVTRTLPDGVMVAHGPLEP